MREDAPQNLVKLAFGRAMVATFDKGSWLELGLLADTEHVIRNHPRLLRALSFGDDDYKGGVHDVLPEILGESSGRGKRHFLNLDEVENYVGLAK